jgi:type II secretory pathway component GspD/PulD (secretin)
VLCLYGAPAFASPSPSPSPSPSAARSTSPTATSTWSVARLARLVADRTGRTFIVAAEVRERPLVLITPPETDLARIPRADLYRLFLSALAQAGVIVVPHDSYERLDAAPRAAGASVPVLTTPESLPDDDRRVTVLVSLHHMPVDDALRVVKPLLAADAVAVGDPRTGRLVLADAAATLRRALAVLRVLDRPNTSAPDLFVVELHHADAAELGPLLDSLAEQGPARP